MRLHGSLSRPLFIVARPLLTCGSDALGWPYQGPPEERSLSASNMMQPSVLEGRSLPLYNDTHIMIHNEV